ncbi:MAG TPA: YgjP-like metallopeptidase domain-containing protein, partial [Bacteroidales bacterium]|nr:YgjP-like metallopeptidase domain-containing protein [Bacteroidales bacterium]
MPRKYYAHPAFGEIALKKNRLSKGLRIIIRSSNSITVTFPYHLTYNEAIRFVNEKEGWIKENLKRIGTLIPAKKAFLPGAILKTFAHELFFAKLEHGNPYIKVDREKITVYYTDEEMLSS